MADYRSQPASPIVIACQHVTDLFDWIAAQGPSSTTMVFCGTREDFVDRIIQDLPIPEAKAKAKQDDAPSSQSWRDKNASISPLLAPTLQNIALLSNLHIAYTPTLHHLRAYLATSNDREGTDGTLILFNVLLIHQKSDSEFSAQGVSATFAAAVETARRRNARLLCVEITNNDQEDGELGLLETRIPLLNGSLRGGENGVSQDNLGERKFVGKTIQVKEVLRIWCHVVRGLEDA
jgi:hypothetical protein